MTESQKSEIEKLVANGQLCKLELDEFRALSDEKAEELIAKSYTVAPLTHCAATKEQKDRLRSYISQRVIPLSAKDVLNLTYTDAEFLLNIALEKSFNGDKALNSVNERIGLDTELATEKQLNMIRHLVEGKYLSSVSTENLVAMSKLTARKLIFKGEMKKRGEK